MATEKTVTASYYEAYESSIKSDMFHGMVIPNMMRGPKERVTIIGTTITEIVAKAKLAGEVLAQHDGHGFAILFNVPKGTRKPAGFDAATRHVHVALTPEPKG